MNRKIIYVVIILLPFIIGMSCENRMFEFTSHVKMDNVFSIDKTGPFSATSVVQESSIRKFLDDLPRDANIKEVKVNQLSVYIQPKAENDVTELELSGKVGNFVTLEDLFSKNDYKVELGDAYFSKINTEIAAGIFLLKFTVEKYIKDFNNFNHTITFKILELSINGKPTNGTRLAADIHIRMDIQIVYEQCIEVWDYLESGEECTMKAPI